jgi:N-dimethylarginine dimethylaminohydrolase
MDLNIPSYQGLGWSPRSLTNREESSLGQAWIRFGVTDQYSDLKLAALCLPNPRWPSPTDWHEIQYLRAVRFDNLRSELQNYADTLQEYGVNVFLHELPLVMQDGRVPYNAIFARDLMTITPEGAICSRMASLVRRGEELQAQKIITLLSVPTIFGVHGSGTFEGADMIWIDEKNVLVGVGIRTNRAAVGQISALLGLQGINVHAVPISGQFQHLLGIVQIVSRRLAFVRAAYASSKLRNLLHDFGVHVVALEETHEVTHMQAMNFLPLRENAIVMPAGTPLLRQVVEAHGVEVLDEVSVQELVAAGGGLGCATAIVRRQTVSLSG